jgi:hypothetical protein
VEDYSPKRRTALVLTGSGTAGAYHAGVLKALDESGVKLDLLVGSGAGAIAAAFGAAAAGPRLYGPDGFWDRVSGPAFYRARRALYIPGLLLGVPVAAFVVPLVLALVGGILFPVYLIVERLAPGWTASVLGPLWLGTERLSALYLAALALPVFTLAAAAILALIVFYLRDRRRFLESFEAWVDVAPGASRLRRGLWEIARGPAVGMAPPSDAELGKRYVAQLNENLGQPGFRELVLRTADLETGRVLPFVLLRDERRMAFAAARGPQGRWRVDGMAGAVDLRAAGYPELLFDAVITGLMPGVAGPLQRVAFPRGGLHAGEVHRLADAVLGSGSGIAEALAAGADQVILASAVPAEPALPPRRRGPRARLDGVLSTLERAAVDRDLQACERINRMVETMGQKAEDGRRVWQDPATGKVYRAVTLYVVRPEKRLLGPLELDGARDPGTEVMGTTADLVEQGYRDAYRMFVEPVVGAVPLSKRLESEEEDQPVMEI